MEERIKQITSGGENEQLFSMENIDENLLIVDSPELVVDQWLAEKVKQEGCNAVSKRGTG
ncbi:MAG TPA: hypothetical protein VIZ18_06360 [Ktedonobacteraceae bacterium]